MRSCTSCSIDDALIPSVQGAVTNVYTTRLSTDKDSAAIIRLTWSRTRAGPALAVAVNDKPISTTGARGTFSFTFSKNSVVGVCWDFSAARYSLGPEPISDFYVAVIFNNEFALLVGDKSKDFVGSFGCGDNPIADFSMVSRTVKVVGRAIYSTKARFYDEGKEHEIMIKFQGELELSMHVGEKKVLHVQKLRWNFRGNETVFVDGLAVDVMWDLFPWLFEDPAGCAVVLLRTRAAAGSRLWLEEEEERVYEGFSLLIQVSQ